MKTDLLVLGTSGGAPTKYRNCTSFILRTESYGIMLDCAEGTQRQLIRAGYKISKIRYIFISHLHFDHIGGLIPLLSTKSMFGIDGKVTIVGPKGIKDFIDFNLSIASSGVFYELDVIEASEGSETKFKDFGIITYKLNHRIESFGFRIIFDDKPGNIIREKLERFGLSEGPVCGKLKKGEPVELESGRKITLKDVATPPKKGMIIGFTGDTYLCKGLYRTVDNADLGIIESTFLNSDEDRASVRTHLTVGMAANTAERAGVKELVLYHFSAAYTDLLMFNDQASEKFRGNLHVPHDLDIIELNMNGEKNEDI